MLHKFAFALMLSLLSLNAQAALTFTPVAPGTDTEHINRSATVINANAAYAIMAWIKTNDGNAYQHFWNLGGTFIYDGNAEAIGTDNDGTTRRVSSAGGSANQFPTSGSFTADTWTHVAVVRESTTSLKVYVDGSEITGLAITADVSGRASTSLMTLMNYHGSGINGKMADVKIWQASLTSGEVTTEMNNKAPQKSGAWAYLPMDDTGTVAANLTDQSGNSRDFTLSTGTGTIGVDADYPTFGGGGGSALPVIIQQQH